MLVELHRDIELIDRLLKDATRHLHPEEYIKLKYAVIKALDKHLQEISLSNQDNNQ